MTLSAHLKYLRYVLRHKWFVWQEGRKLGLGWWQLFIHDWHKFLPSEWTPYVKSFYGGWKYSKRPPEVVEDFNKAWLHHIHFGLHHWQHWLLVFDDDSNDLLPLPMPRRYMVEMLADWRGASRAITGEDNTKEWYLKRRERFTRVIHPATRKWIEDELGIVAETME